MFERYNEEARRSLFFARYEASVLGGQVIETYHLLLGLLRDEDDLIARLLATAGVTRGVIRHLVYERAEVRTSLLAVSEEIPFSDDATLVLQYTFEESDRLLHGHVGVEHLLLGLLRLERGLAWEILRENGLELTSVREALVMHVSATASLPPELEGMLAALVPGAAPRPHRPGPLYFMTALDGPSPGRRRADDTGTGGFTNVSALMFSTYSEHPPGNRAHSIGPISMAGATLVELALLLETFLGAPVMVDDGSMPGIFDIELQGVFHDVDTLIAALRDQLGLEVAKSVG